MDENSETQNIRDAQQTASHSRVRKFEIAVYNVNEENDGKPQLQRVMFEQPVYVEAESPKDLQEKLSLYKKCGQIAKIVREIGPAPDSHVSVHSVQNSSAQIQSPAAMFLGDNQLPPATQRPQIVQPQVRQKPKFFKIGDIEVKDDNGKIYEKQWMRLSDSESSNIRVINDKNNGLVNLTGKHIEMKKWVLVENINEDTDLEDNL